MILDIKSHKYNCCDFSQVNNIGVICRGESLGQIEKYKKYFKNIFVAGQNYNSFQIIGQYIKESNIVKMSGNTFNKPNKKYIQLYKEYRIKDLQTSLDPTLSDRKKLKFIKLQNVYKDILEVHSMPLRMRDRNLRFMSKRKYGNGKKSYPTIGLWSVDMACLYNPKNIHIIGLDFYCADVFVKEDYNVSRRKNVGKTESMIEYFKLLCEEESKIQFYLYTCCEEINSEGNLKVMRV